MLDETQSRGSNGRLDEIIAQYYLALEQGRAIDRAALLDANPELRLELQAFFSDLDQVNDALRDPFTHTPPEAVQPSDHRGSNDSSSSMTAGSKIKYFGEFEILDELGAGGMGVVYKAKQTRLKKIVALKMIRSGQLARPAELQRFESEARAAAKLDHPGIVPVHEVGVHRGQHYYTMDYVGGGSLANLHRDEPIVARRAAELVKQLADAMHYAHGQGIVHRDLKPANVLLTTNGVPRITDFGLAKRLWTDEDTADISLTETGQVLGTAGYMSPEQAAGRTRMIGPAADIYALGAILYAMITTRAPFIGESTAETIRQVIYNEPIAPRALNSAVPQDLETICLKCLEKEPAKRYGSAQQLAEELQRFMEGRPVLARPISRSARVWRWCRRNPLRASVAVLLCVLGFGSVASALGFQAMFQRERQLRQQSDEQYVQNLFDRAIQQAEQEPLLGVVSLAEALKVAETKQVSKLAGSIRFQFSAWMRGYAPPVAHLPHDRPIVAFSIAPDSHSVVTATDAGLRCYAVTGKLVWEQTDLGNITALEHSQNGAQILVSHYKAPNNTPQGDPMATVVELRDAKTGKQSSLISDTPFIVDGTSGRGTIQAKYSPDSRHVLVFGGNTGLLIWDCEQKKQVQMLQSDDPILDAEFSQSGSYLMLRYWASPQDRPRAQRVLRVRVWNTRNWSAEESPWATLPELNMVTFSKTSRYVCAMTTEEIAVFDRETNQWLRARFKVSLMRRPLPAFQEEGPILVITDVDNTLSVGNVITWNPTNGMQAGFQRAVANRKGFIPTANVVTVGPFTRSKDARWIVKTKRFEDRGSDWRISAVCDAKNGIPVGRSVLLYDDKRTEASFSNDGRLLAIREIDRESSDSDKPAYGLTLWRCDDLPAEDWKADHVQQRMKATAPDAWRLLQAIEQVQPKQIKGIRPYLSAHRMVLSADDTIVLAPGETGVRLIKDGRESRFAAIPEREHFVSALRFSPDQQTLAIAGHNGMPIYLCDFAKRTVTCQLVCERDWINCLAFSPDGKQIAAGSYKSARRVRVWNVADSKLVHSWPTTSDVFAVEFSHNGELVAAGVENSRLHVWNARTGQMVWSRSQQPVQPIVSVCFSTDDKLIASATSDGAVQLFDATTGSKIGTTFRSLYSSADPLSMYFGKVLFSNDDESVMWIGMNRTFAEWPLPSGLQGSGSELVQLAKASTALTFDRSGLIRRLTSQELSDIMPASVRLPP